MQNKIIVVLFGLFSPFTIWAQHTDIGLEVQQYPTGFLTGLRVEKSISPQQALELRLGYNSLDHKDFGVHETEVGGGFGFTLGYRYYFNSDAVKLFLGVRSDLWFNSVDWSDTVVFAQVMGTTKIVVLQPTAVIGYAFPLGKQFIVTPNLAFGAEFNIATEGAPVGEGAVLLWGIQLSYRL